MLNNFKKRYLEDPCHTSALAFYKAKNFIVPDNIKVIHCDEYDEHKYQSNNITKYFRMIYRYKNKQLPTINYNDFLIKKVDINTDLNVIVQIINESYPNINVNTEIVLSWLNEEVYDETLWILVIDIEYNIPIGLGIAIFDIEINEGCLDWIQVLPKYRRKGIGTIIVNELLHRLATKADFVTVSGEVDNISRPDKLYRNCEFTGDDIWYIIR